MGFGFRCEPPHVRELRREKESPPAHARRLAAEKAASALDRAGGEPVVLAADTVVHIGEEILDKPQSDLDAMKALEVLSGRAHKVVTGVAVCSGGTIHQQVVTTTVRFRDLSPEEIRWYVSTGEPKDKAGAYAIQGIGAFMVASIDGSPTNVIGLPLVETLEMLRDAGVEMPWSRPAPFAPERNGD